MDKNLILGAASGYDWDKLKYWVNSIRKTGYTGDVALVGSNMTKETIDKLTENGVILLLNGTVTERGDVSSNSNLAPHVERFIYLFDFLEKNGHIYKNVVVTDTRDVIFQTDPMKWLDENMGETRLVVSCEGMRYMNEPWNDKNLKDTFGEYLYNHMKHNFIYNVGVIGGNAKFVKRLMNTIFYFSINRPIPIVDQAVFNFLVDNADEMDLSYTFNKDAWAIQLGTTVEAVRSGRGDLGMLFSQNVSEYEKRYEDEQPIINEDGTVVTQDGLPFAIVHQYDRIKSLKEKIEHLYGDN